MSLIHFFGFFFVAMNNFFSTYSIIFSLLYIFWMDNISMKKLEIWIRLTKSSLAIRLLNYYKSVEASVIQSYNLKYSLFLYYDRKLIKTSFEKLFSDGKSFCILSISKSGANHYCAIWPAGRYCSPSLCRALKTVVSFSVSTSLNVSTISFANCAFVKSRFDIVRASIKRRW